MHKGDERKNTGLNPKEQAAADRDMRLRTQLRTNIQRRKAQVRSRSTKSDKK